MHRRNEHQPISAPPRAGYLYVAVMITATLVGLVGLSAVSVARLNLRTTTRTVDSSSADFLAQSAVEHALAVLKNDPAWRTTYLHNTEYPSTPISLNGGTITWKLVDPDTSLLDDDSDTVRIYGIGRQGSATSVQSVLLYPTENPLSCTEAAFHCAGSVNLDLLINWTTDDEISSNGSLSASALGASITGNAYAAGSITGSISGTKTSGATTRRMPGSSVLDYYKARGTWVDINTLPLSIGKRVIQKAIISPATTPWGATNSAGIYVIDCGGQNLEIKNSRILGTLVLLNPGTGCLTSSAVHWDTVVPNLPALLVDGDFQLGHTQPSLNEANLSTNFNPAGTPYESNSDSDTTDEYASEINGLVYTSGKLTVLALLSRTKVNGSVVCNSSSCNSAATFNHNSVFTNFPPPGFASGSLMESIPGSWRRDVLP
tara:strand:+ start:64527 stop:65819 length:1293 start_codon:yes stop_codon:yes gene_type:complete